MSDPFGETPVPWWRRVRRRGDASKTPEQVSGALAFLTAFPLLLPSGVHHDLVAKLAAAALIVVVPSLLVEAWYRQRNRRASEELLRATSARASGGSSAEGS